MVHTSLDGVIENYRKLLREHGHGPLVAQCSPEGQLARNEKLMEAGAMSGKRILEIGCGLGDMLPMLKKKAGGLFGGFGKKAGAKKEETTPTA